MPMGRREGEGEPEDIKRARQEFEAWRRKGRPGKSIPEELWRKAAAAGQRHGTSRVSQAIGISYMALRRHMAEETGPAQATTQPEAGVVPQFVELGNGGGATFWTGEYTLEWRNSRGEIFRVEARSRDAADLEKLSRAFLER